MMGIQIELTKFNGRETVDIKKNNVDILKNTVDILWFYAAHGEFKAACCRDLGLVDPKDAPYPISQDDVDELCRRRMVDKTKRAANHAVDGQGRLMTTFSQSDLNGSVFDLKEFVFCNEQGNFLAKFVSRLGWEITIPISLESGKKIQGFLDNKKDVPSSADENSFYSKVVLAAASRRLA